MTSKSFSVNPSLFAIVDLSWKLSVSSCYDVLSMTLLVRHGFQLSEYIVHPLLNEAAIKRFR